MYSKYQVIFPSGLLNISKGSFKKNLLSDNDSTNCIFCTLDMNFTDEKEI